MPKTSKKELTLLSKRFLQAVDSLGISIYKLEKDIPILSSSKITHIRRGRNEPSRDLIDAIVQNFPILDPNWIYTGIGIEPIKKENDITHVGNSTTHELIAPVESNALPGTIFVKEDLIEVPFVSKKATASFVESCCSDNYDTLETIAVPGISQEDLKKYKYVVFEISGNSMFPTLTDGSKVLSKFVDPNNWEYANGVYVTCYRDHLVAKRIKKNDLLLHGTLTLCSDNPQHGETTILKSDIRGVWEALYTIYQKIE